MTRYLVQEWMKKPMAVLESKKSVGQLALEKEQRTMETVAWRAAYYRANPQRFVSEVLGIELRLFQKILIWCMMHYNYVMYLAARGFNWLHHIEICG